MKTKGRRILKNGAIGAYVYYPSDKKWKWRIIGHARKTGGKTVKKKTKKRGGGARTCEYLKQNPKLLDEHPFYQAYNKTICELEKMPYYMRKGNVMGKDFTKDYFQVLGRLIDNKNAFIKEHRYTNDVAYKISKPFNKIKLEKWENGEKSKMSSEDILADYKPKTTIKGLGFKDKEKAKYTVDVIKNMDYTYQMNVINTMINRAKYHPHKNKNMEEAIVIFEKYKKKLVSNHKKQK